MEVAIGDLSVRKFDGSALSSRHKNLATLCPRLKNCWIHYQTNAPQLPKSGSNCRKSLDAKIEKLQKLRDTLSDCIGCGCLSLKSCGRYNPQDIMAQDGPGLRRLDLKKKPEQSLGQSNREEAYLFPDMHGVRLVLRLR